MVILGLSDVAWIGIIFCIACIAVGIYLIRTKKPGMVRRIADDARYKDSEKYAVEGGKLILYLAGACFVMVIISIFSVLISTIFGLVCICIFGYFWKKMDDEYGPV